MIYNFRAIANYFIKKATNSKKPSDLTPMKIQKLVYFSHGTNLAVNNAPLIDSTFQAWEHGPIIPELYFELEYYKNRIVSELLMLKKVLTNSKDFKFEITIPFVDKNDMQTEEILEFISSELAPSSGLHLALITKKEGTPWSKSYSKNSNKTIDDAIIKDYFKTIIYREQMNTNKGDTNG